MTTLLLATRLQIPPVGARVVPRPRLVERIPTSPQHRLALISAPAGFGKTTLVTEWIAGGEQAVAWLSLDRVHSHLDQFLLYLGAALKTIEPTVGEALAGSPPPSSMELHLTSLLNELAAVPQPFCLVLDDYHVVDSPQVDQAVSFLLANMPPQMQLVIATREDPNLPLARLRARGQLTELRVADLRFTSSEAADFLNQQMGLELCPEDIAALESRTEGWIAGLQLAALSMQGREDSGSFVRSFTSSNRFVLDYLVEEVLDRQSERVQEFLLQTSVLDRLCGPLCDAVLQAPDGSGQQALEALEKANIFLIPLDSRRYWYRYHHLFAELLRQRLLVGREGAGGGPDAGVKALHSRASRWFEGMGHVVEAISYSVLARAYVRAAELLEGAWEGMDSSFTTQTWLRHAEQLSDELVSARPLLSAQYGWALLNNGQLELSLKRLADVESCLAQLTAGGVPLEEVATEGVVLSTAHLLTVPVLVATARAYHAQAIGDIEASMSWSHRALEGIPEEDHSRRATVGLGLGLSYWAAGDLATAFRFLVDGQASMRASGQGLFALAINPALADILLRQGCLRNASRLIDRAIVMASAPDAPQGPAIESLYAVSAGLHVERGDGDTAREKLRKSEKLAERAALQDWRYRWGLAHASLCTLEGDLDGALEMIRQAEENIFPGPLPDEAPVAAQRARVWLAMGRLSEAEGWLRESELSADDELCYLREYEHITLARVLLARNALQPSASLLQEATGLLERLLESATAGGRTARVIEVLLLQALALDGCGEESQALALLEHALTLAEPDGLVRVFVIEGRPMQRLLVSAVAKGLAPGFSRQLLEACEPGSGEVSGQVQSSSSPAQPLVEPLSDRELDVLRLVAEGLSNRQVGARLFVALTTVKGHNQRIFAKLGVKRRTEAVARARELGLL